MSELETTVHHVLLAQQDDPSQGMGVAFGRTFVQWISDGQQVEVVEVGVSELDEGELERVRALGFGPGQVPEVWARELETTPDQLAALVREVAQQLGYDPSTPLTILPDEA